MSSDPLFRIIHPDFTRTFAAYRSSLSRDTTFNETCFISKIRRDDLYFIVLKQKSFLEVVEVSADIKSDNTLNHSEGNNVFNDIVECIVCYDVVDQNHSWRSSCMLPTSAVCATCMHSYITSKILVSEVSANRTIACPCPTFECESVVTESDVHQFLSQDGEMSLEDKQTENKFILFCENVEVSTDPCKK